MVKKYSEIFKKLKFNQEEINDDIPALITHYFQNKDDKTNYYYQQDAESFISTISEPEFNYLLPFEYDVPFPPKRNPDFTFIDLFAGIGGFRLAFQELNGKCVFSSEWNKYAKITYEANFGEIPFGDITKIDENKIPEHDILVGGFPCQPFSIAGVSKKNALGKEHGFLDKTQGTLFFDIARIINAKRPKAFLLENVKNLKSHDKGKTYQVIKDTLEKLDYHVFSEVIDAKYFVPQHRERIYILGFNKSVFNNKINFKFPDKPENKPILSDILEKEVDSKYTLSDKLWNYLQSYATKHLQKGNGFGYGLINQESISRTLSARYYKDGSEILVPQGNGKNPRKLTPLECKRLMGFPENFKINDIGVSDTQLYKQFGNSVAVPVVRKVATSLINFLNTVDKNKGCFKDLKQIRIKPAQKIRLVS